MRFPRVVLGRVFVVVVVLVDFLCCLSAAPLVGRHYCSIYWNLDNFSGFKLVNLFCSIIQD